MKTAVLAVLFMLSTGTAFGQSQWELVYENDANGEALSGSLEGLIGAIQQGDDIKIYFKMGRGDTFVEHTAQVQFTTVMNGPSGQYVTGQITPITGQIPDFDKGMVSLKENLQWSLIASTSGQYDTMTRNVITGEIVDHQVRQWATRWFRSK